MTHRERRVSLVELYGDNRHSMQCCGTCLAVNFSEHCTPAAARGCSGLAAAALVGVGGLFRAGIVVCPLTCHGCPCCARTCALCWADMWVHTLQCTCCAEHHCCYVCCLSFCSCCHCCGTTAKASLCMAHFAFATATVPACICFFLSSRRYFGAPPDGAPLTAHELKCAALAQERHERAVLRASLEEGGGGGGGASSQQGLSPLERRAVTHQPKHGASSSQRSLELVYDQREVKAAMFAVAAAEARAREAEARLLDGRLARGQRTGHRHPAPRPQADDADADAAERAEEEGGGSGEPGGGASRGGAALRSGTLSGVLVRQQVVGGVVAAALEHEPEPEAVVVAIAEEVSPMHAHYAEVAVAAEVPARLPSAHDAKRRGGGGEGGEGRNRREVVRDEGGADGERGLHAAASSLPASAPPAASIEGHDHDVAMMQSAPLNGVDTQGRGGSGGSDLPTQRRQSTPQTELPVDVWF